MINRWFVLICFGINKHLVSSYLLFDVWWKKRLNIQTFVRMRVCMVFPVSIQHVHFPNVTIIIFRRCHWSMKNSLLLFRTAVYSNEFYFLQLTWKSWELWAVLIFQLFNGVNDVDDFHWTYVYFKLKIFHLIRSILVAITIINIHYMYKTWNLCPDDQLSRPTRLGQSKSIKLINKLDEYKSTAQRTKSDSNSIICWQIIDRNKVTVQISFLLCP